MNDINHPDEGFNLFNFNKLFNKEIQLSYKGPFHKNVLSVLGNYIRINIGKNSLVSNKIFKIFIELAQNISFYSAESNSIEPNTGIGTLVIREQDTKIYLHAGNIVKTDDVEPILDRCEIINSLDREGLREYKREQRNLPRGVVHGGAHIGLIQVALTSANPLDIKVTQFDDVLSFFSVTVKVDSIEKVN